MLQIRPLGSLVVACALAASMPFPASAQSAVPDTINLNSGWQLQDVAKVPQSGAEVSAVPFAPAGWYAAVVPGTVLTSLVNDNVYPEPLYGENNRPEVIPESLARTSYWYRKMCIRDRPGAQDAMFPADLTMNLGTLSRIPHAPAATDSWLHSRIHFIFTERHTHSPCLRGRLRVQSGFPRADVGIVIMQTA